LGIFLFITALFISATLQGEEQFDVVVSVLKPKEIRLDGVIVEPAFNMPGSYVVIADGLTFEILKTRSRKLSMMEISKVKEFQEVVNEKRRRNNPEVLDMTVFKFSHYLKIEGGKQEIEIISRNGLSFVVRDGKFSRISNLPDFISDFMLSVTE
jgi:hypothetical protein